MRKITKSSGRQVLALESALHWWPLLAASIAVWSGVVGASDSLRCGSYLVSVGDSFETVRARCGPPSSRYDTAAGIIWIYNFGPNRFLEQLRFLNGRLADINSHGYGFSSSSSEHPPLSDQPPSGFGLPPYPLQYQNEAPMYQQYFPFRRSEHRSLRSNNRHDHKRRKYHERMFHQGNVTKRRPLSEEHHENRYPRKDEEH